jgi:hypothetical protein
MPQVPEKFMMKEPQRRQILTIERRELTMETHEQGSFEVIAGKSVVAFRRDDEDEVRSAKCFGYVQSYDEKQRQGKRRSRFGNSRRYMSARRDHWLPGDRPG